MPHNFILSSKTQGNILPLQEALLTKQHKTRNAKLSDNFQIEKFIH